MKQQLKYKNEETDNVNLFESKIVGIKLDAKTSNIELTIDWTEGDNITALFENCCELEINLRHHSQFPDNVIGVLEISGFSYKKCDNDYIIQYDFDFNLMGQIRFKCNHFVFFTSTIPIQNGGNDNLII